MPLDLVAQVNKHLKKNVAFYANNKRFKLVKIPTGIVSVDRMLGGGVPMGRWIEIYGDHSGLKTTMALMVMANAQKKGYSTLYIDQEHTMTENFFKMRGVDTSPEFLNVIQVENGEDVTDVIEIYLRQGQHKVIVVDSIAAMSPRKMGEASASKDSMGLEGKMTSQMTRKLTAINQDTAIIAINQTRDSIGRFFGPTPKVTPGGRALGFYSSQRIEVIRGAIEWLRKKTEDGKTDKTAIRRTIHFILHKDKTGAREEDRCEVPYDIRKSQIDLPRDLLNVCIQEGIIEVTGKKVYVLKRNKYDEKSILKILSKPKIYSHLRDKVLA